MLRSRKTALLVILIISCSLLASCYPNGRPFSKIDYADTVVLKDMRGPGIYEIKDRAAIEAFIDMLNGCTYEKLDADDPESVFKKYESTLDPGKNHLVLVNPSDMGNLGTIIRTMIAFEINDLAIITPGADIFDPKVIRASMGAFFRLRCAHFSSFEEYMKTVTAEDRSFYPFILGGKPMEQVPPCPTKNFSLIFGNEARGLPESFENVGTPVRIDHADTVDSLNLTIAAAIGIYNFVKGNKND